MNTLFTNYFDTVLMIIGVTLVCTFLVDWLGCLYSSTIRKSQSTRWIFIHLIANATITVLCVNDLLSVLRQPFYSLLSSPERIAEVGLFVDKAPGSIAVGIHLYHMIFFKNLTIDDWMHHLISGVFCGCVSVFIDWGPQVNYITFFMTGLPGMLNYAMLLACKFGKMDGFTQKRFNTHINFFMRMPGLLFSSFMGYGESIQPHFPPERVTLSLVVGAATVWNSVYFAHCVVKDYYYSKGKMDGLRTKMD